MQDRLAELRRQRALVAEHLAWLDREIAAVPAVVPAVPAQPTPAPAPASAAIPIGNPLPAASQPEPSAATPADALPLPEAKPAEIKDDVRRGCLLYFALASLFAITVIALLIWASQAYKKSHPPKPRVQQIEQSQP